MRGLAGSWILLALAGCGSGDPPTLRPLLEPAPTRSGPPGGSLASRPGAHFDPATGTLTLEQRLPAELWTRAAPGHWTMPRPPGFLPDGLSLTRGTDVLPFSLGRERLRVDGLAGPDAPDDVNLRLTLVREAAGEHGGALLPLWPGEALSWPLEVPADSVLSFRLLVLASRAGAPCTGTLTVEQDGEPCATLALRAGNGHDLSFLRVPLRPARNARVVLRLEGEVLTWLASPALAPAQLGSPAQRPWADPRPDLVLFLADTFRADLLAHLGGSGATPALDALAARSRRFLAARSPSTWTLPAHASLFTGLWPGEHGADRPELCASPELVTLAETLRRAGYRTGAVTEAGYVRRAYGLDRGFEWFLEQTGVGGPRLARTLAAADAFLEADDGRPVFLFVHTYRTHWPYLAEDEQVPRRAIALRRAQVAPGHAQESLDSAQLAELRALYTSAARALDREFSPWFARLEASGRLRRGLFVFTSDHGEAFQEHGALFHGEAPREPVARIPLLLHGARVPPGDVSFGASLVDLFPTLTAFAGVTAPPGLSGTDLLALAEERPLLCESRGSKAHHLAVVAGAQKLLAAGSGELALPRDAVAFHDLARDPEEQDNRLETPAGQAFLPLAEGAWLDRRRLRATPQAVTRAPSVLDELRALGYGE